jgi:hypothetical protein
MKKRLVLTAMLSVALALGMVLAGCDNGSSGGGGEYHLKWGVASVSYSTFQSTITSEGWSLADSGGDWSLVTGSTATSAYNYCDAYLYWYDEGDFDGSFEACVNFSEDGISAPSGLKNSSSTITGNVPLAGIFDASGLTVLFYVTEN